MRRNLAAALVLLAACGAERKPSAAVEAPVAKGGLRVRALRPQERWEGAWLATEGWDFFGYRLDAGSDGDMALTWRTAAAEIAQVRCALRAQEPVSIVYGVRARPPMRAETTVECPACGARTVLRGPSHPESVVCKRCKTEVPSDLEWHTAPEREFRIMMRGRFLRPGHSQGLTVAGQVSSSEFGQMIWLFGRMRARDVPVGAGGACDPVALMHGGGPTFRPGLYEPFSRRIPLPGGVATSSSVSRENGGLEFSFTAGNVKIHGTQKGYRILVGGRETPLDEYPYPVWDFTLSWRP